MQNTVETIYLGFALMVLPLQLLGAIQVLPKKNSFIKS